MNRSLHIKLKEFNIKPPHFYLGKLGGSEGSSAAQRAPPQTAPPAVGGTNLLSAEDERPLPNTGK